MSRFFRRLGVIVRPSEIPLTLVLFLHCLLIGVFQFSSKAVRQSLFVDALGADQLPWVYLLVAILAYPVVRFYSSLARRGVSWPRVIMSTSLGMALGLVGFWFLLGFEQNWIRFVLYLFISICTVLGMSQFFIWAAQLLDARQARRLFGFLGAGGLLGGVLGGQVAAFASQFETRHALLAGAVPLLLVAAIIRPVLKLYKKSPHEAFARGGGPKAKPEDSLSEGIAGGFATLRESPLLMAIAATTFVGVLVSQVVDLQFNFAVEARSGNLEESTRLFGNLYSLMGLAGFLFQLLLTPRIHRVLGVGFALRVMPVFVGVGSALMLIAGAVFPPALIWIVGSLKAGENGLRYSLDQSTRELLFMPVDARQRERSKAYIDVLVQRVGKSVAAILLLTVTFGWVTMVGASWLAIGLCALWLAFVWVARREYVESLRSNVRVGSREHRDSDIDLDDATTLERVVEFLGSADGHEVLHSLELLDRHGRGRLVSPLLLHHTDSKVRLRTLSILSGAGRRDSVPLIETLLADSDIDVRAAAVQSIAKLSGKNGPALMESRLEDPDLRVRAAAIACLYNQGDEDQAKVAETALGELLSDADPAARSEAARAIGEIDEPLCRGQLVTLLYDSNPDVVIESIQAVRKRLERCGVQPHYTPILISLLRDRRLKHQARSALVALGEIAVPALEHFMNDSNEQLWVRRALPKTLSGVGGYEARAVLLRALDSDDRFLKGKVIEALLSIGPLGFEAAELNRIEAHVVQECRRGMQALQAIAGLLGSDQQRHPTFTVQGGSIRLLVDDPQALLEKLLSERYKAHVDNAFHLLALLPGDDTEMEMVRSKLIDGTGRNRADALEYLDNVLSPTLRRWLLVLIDDYPLHERLDRAERLLESPTLGRRGTLRQLLEAPADDSICEEDAWLTASALHAIHLTGDRSLRPLIERVRKRTRSQLVEETADWVVAQEARIAQDQRSVS